MERRSIPSTNWGLWEVCFLLLVYLPALLVTFVPIDFLLSFRDAVSKQEMESQLDFQKSTGAFSSEKDRELETLRNEVHLRSCRLSSVGIF